MLDTEPDVIRCLVTYTDWWHPVSTSILEVPSATRSAAHGTGFRPGFVDSLDERAELLWRLAWLDDTDRTILFLYYVAQHPPATVAEAVGLSPRQCSRRRTQAIRTLAELAWHR